MLLWFGVWDFLTVGNTRAAVTSLGIGNVGLGVLPLSHVTKEGVKNFHLRFEPLLRPPKHRWWGKP